MVRVHFTPNIQRHLSCPTTEVAGKTVRAVLDAVFTANPAARGYVLDDQGAVRKHVAVFIDGNMIVDRELLSDPVSDSAEIYVMQALSGG